MNKIDISYNKKLKLINPLILTIDLEREDANLDVLIEQMEAVIRTKGAKPVGPLIQYTEVKIDETGEGEIVLKLMLQADKYIDHIEPPYKIEAVLEVTGCMYARYQGPEDKLPLAYQKLHVAAFEEDISLKDANYTVFIGGDEDGDITADVFIEKA